MVDPEPPPVVAPPATPGAPQPPNAEVSSAFRDETTRRSIGVLIICAFVGFAFWTSIRGSLLSAELTGIIIGYLAGQSGSVTNYYFGSSSGSTQKSLATVSITSEKKGP
jgi:hypothetical protein